MFWSKNSAEIEQLRIKADEWDRYTAKCTEGIPVGAPHSWQEVHELMLEVKRKAGLMPGEMTSTPARLDPYYHEVKSEAARTKSSMEAAEKRVRRNLLRNSIASHSGIEPNARQAILTILDLIP